MKRVAIFASYSKDGVIAPYVIYYLKGLKAVADRIIFIADNEASSREEEKIIGLVIYSQFKRHGCYDFGSYRRGYEWAEKRGLLQDADELIFCNDSCYGPIYPFEEVFAKMEKRDCDFWGMVSSCQVRFHLQSNFLVFKKKVFSSEIFASFVKSFEAQKDFWNYVLMYETRFAEHLCNAGFKCSSLIDCADYEKRSKGFNPTFFPVSVLKDGLPLIKRKMFGHQHRGMLKESLSETLRLVKSINREVYNFIWRDNNAVVLIPVYKKEPSVNEKESLLQVLRVLSFHDIRFVCPKGLDMSLYDKIVGYVLPKERFDRKFFDGIQGYNLLMTDVSFYRRFSDYEYMLIYQLDAWVFSDQLAEWCAKGYDYVGAPWFEAHKTHEEGYPLWCCGNGGFSLRRISKFIEVTNPRTRFISPKDKNIRKYFCSFKTFGKGLKYMLGLENNMARYRKEHSYLWEDTYFSYGLDGTPHEMKRPSPEEAAEFSFECSPKYLYNLIGKKLPFGCHAWRRYQYDEFWHQYIDTKKNKISIVTINYNNLEGLKRTQESIACQTYKDYEWIVVDGGSTDGSKEFIEKHSNEMSFWCSEKDGGVYNAQNKGTKHASGDYVIYMNSGDTFYDAHVLEDIFMDFQTEDVLYGDWTQVFPNGKEKNLEPSPNADYLFFLTDNICHQAMFIKTQLLKESPYDESYKLYADWAKWAELSYKDKSFKYFHRMICNFMMGGISGENEENNAKERERIKKEFYPESISIWAIRQDNQIRVLSAKRRKHNRIIRWLIFACGLLLVTNLITWLYILCK